MIPVTRLDGNPILLNDDLIETIRQAPDTVVSLVNGRTLLVRDTPDDILARVIAFRQAVQRSSARQSDGAGCAIAELAWSRG